jgi:hypothetical protein
MLVEQIEFGEVIVTRSLVVVGKTMSSLRLG